MDFPSSHSSKNPSTDHHVKTNVRDRRVSLSPKCAERIVELKEKLGHRYAGQTIQWLLVQAKPYVDAVIGTKAMASLPVNDTIIKVPSFGHPDPHHIRFNPPVVPSPAPTEVVSSPAPPTSLEEGLDIDIDLSAEDIEKILLELSE